MGRLTRVISVGPCSHKCPISEIQKKVVRVICLLVLKIGGPESRHKAASESGKSKEMDSPFKASEEM